MSTRPRVQRTKVSDTKGKVLFFLVSGSRVTKTPVHQDQKFSCLTKLQSFIITWIPNLILTCNSRERTISRSEVAVRPTDGLSSRDPEPHDFRRRRVEVPDPGLWQFWSRTEVNFHGLGSPSGSRPGPSLTVSGRERSVTTPKSKFETWLNPQLRWTWSILRVTWGLT